ncbi:MAG: hypothetical protein P8O16_08210 [Algoriphagus sp.]|uniref:hypothetical protein n=1 Tax=Algoriphagus sp. TaxID=1872435 RepID=UPI0026264A72|nr:hypothetical protein [Algoriphagus sp.]MDG1277248.1 hypothetical protein [Algoriphagus sp.]
MLNEEFKLVVRKYLPIILAFLLIPLISYSFWLFYPIRQLEIVVIDKSVTNDTYNEHQSFYWILEYQKIQNMEDRYYDFTEDYYGYHLASENEPAFGDDFSKLTEAEIEAKIKPVDVLFLADTYGVYKNDLNKTNQKERSSKVFGGLNQGEIKLVREAAKQNKTIIVEFNSFDSPTTKFNRTEIENELGIKWTGWIARYFEELDTTASTLLPKWLITNYLEQHDNIWIGKGPGLVFVHEDGKVEALTYKKDYQSRIPEIRTPFFNKTGFQLPEVVPYPDWFDIVLIDRGYEVVSYFDINPSSEGLEKLKAMGLPRFFPATVVKNSDKGQFYYFSGDFTDMKVDLGSAKFTGLPILWRGFHLVSDYKDRESFFWNYYFPLISQILEKAENRVTN